MADIGVAAGVTAGATAIALSSAAFVALVIVGIIVVSAVMYGIITYVLDENNPWYWFRQRSDVSTLEMINLDTSESSESEL